MAASHGSRDGESAVARHSKEQFDASITWEGLVWRRAVTSLSLVLKSVLTGGDAELAVNHGILGLIVTHHGGRRLNFSRRAPTPLPRSWTPSPGSAQSSSTAGFGTAPTSPRPCAWARTRTR
jgi:4-hydroxymandelate oxidase